MIRRRHLLAAGALPLLGCEPAPAITGGFTGISVARGHALRDLGTPPAPQATRRTQVVIAGAGVAGLAAARALHLRGIEDFVLLELEDDAGGNARAGMMSGIACPQGAHYLPLPGADAHEVQDLLEEFGLRRRVAGRWQYDELHLCHSPQERLFFRGAWQEGLLPLAGVGADTLAQYRRFAAQVDGLARASRFCIPALRAPFTAQHAALDAQTADAWLRAQGLTDAHLRWYLDYCCRDDYGAGLQRVSAWACIHYFASRHGFRAPQASADAEDLGAPISADAENNAVLTWPEGNAWLTRRLAAPLGERLRTGHSVLRIRTERHGVAVDALRHADGCVVRWQAAQCIVALPAFIAARVIEQPPAWLVDIARNLAYAPWLVANLHLAAPLQDRPGAAPAWDNVVYGEPGGGLGYVDAHHQSLDPRPGPTVLSYYRALGDLPGARQQLLTQPWSHWRDAILAALAAPHPDLAQRLTRMDIIRYGHAMAIPQPGTLRRLRQLSAASADARGSHGAPSAQAANVRSGRLHFAHADWSGYSIFEEAFTRGHAAGGAV